MTREKISPLNPGENTYLRQTVAGLSPGARLQLLWGLIQALSLKSSISRKVFEEILIDAVKYSDAIKQL